MATKHLKLTALSTLLLTLSFSHTATADDFNKTIEKALKFGQDDGKYGQIKFDLRFRYENNDSNRSTVEAANALTGRLRLGYLTPVFSGFQAYAEFQGNQDILINDYNNGFGNNPQYERITDPQRNNLDQLWLSYKGIANTEAKIGRQRIQLDNERFIGAAAWRQLERTYDAFMINNTSLPNTTVILGYLDKAQNTNATNDKIQLPLANISYEFKGIGKLTSYAYLLEFNDPVRYQDSNQTYGVRFDGKYKVNDTFDALYTAEYAYQRDYGRSSHYQADYYHIVGGVGAFGITARGGVEQLGGDGANKTFDTPMGLLHKFQGWTDVFNITPDQGVRDVYTHVEANLPDAIKIIAMYHDFSDTKQLHFGDSWGFMVTKEFAKHYTIMAKYVDYNADRQGRVGANAYLFDTQKIWLGFGINY
jgi:hypothetical protein